jgi:hypothetical protein
MDIVLLIQFGFGLIVVLGVLIFFLLSSKKKARILEKRVADLDNARPQRDLNSLKAIIKNKETSEKELKDALDLVLKKYGAIDANIDIYKEILFAICTHPRTNKNIIINFDKELRRFNPDYKTEINDAIKIGLNSRGV